MQPRSYEDYVVGQTLSIGEYRLSQAEMVAFAEQWDPQPFHVDPAAAAASMFGGLTASGCHLLSIAIRLVTAWPLKPRLIAAIGWDELRFPHPARPGDTLQLCQTCLSARVSNSKPDRGIVRNQFHMANQTNQPVLTFQDIILVARRP